MNQIKKDDFNKYFDDHQLKDSTLENDSFINSNTQQALTGKIEKQFALLEKYKVLEEGKFTNNIKSLLEQLCYLDKSNFNIILNEDKKSFKVFKGIGGKKLKDI